MELDGTQSVAPPLKPVEAQASGPISDQPNSLGVVNTPPPTPTNVGGAYPVISPDQGSNAAATAQGVNPAMATTIAQAISLGMVQAPTTAAGWAQLEDQFSNPSERAAVQAKEQQGGAPTAQGAQPTSAGAAGPSMTGSPGSSAGWASTVLQEAGLPSTQNNIDNMLRWMTAEEPPTNWSHANNPLNINAGGSGFDTFASLGQSASATAAVLKQGNMSGIFQALASNADPSSFSAAVVASPWAGSHYGGDPNHIANIPVPGDNSAGLAVSQPAQQMIAQTNGANSSTVVQLAQSQLGIPYAWGGESPGQNFDCSGLVQWAYGQAGDKLPRTAQDQYNATPKVATGNGLQPGDLLFFGSGPNGVEHVGIYIGNGQMIDAPHTGADVRVDQVFGPGGQPLWGNFVGATRPGDPSGTTTAAPGSPVHQGIQANQAQYGSILQQVLAQMSSLNQQEQQKKLVAAHNVGAASL